MNNKNFYIEQFNQWLTYMKPQDAIDRAITRLAGLSLQRGFNESFESFYKRKPQIEEFWFFVKKFQSSQKELSIHKENQKVS